MKTPSLLSTLTLLLFFALTGKSQALLWQETFDNDPFHTLGWVTVDSPSEDLFSWRWAGNGKAEAGIYWDDRPAIGSSSGGGALVFDSDSLLNSAGWSFPHFGFVESPLIELEAGGNLFLEFYQYYRNFQSFTVVEILPESEEPVPIYFSELVGTNVDTGKKDRVVINISDYIDATSPFRIRFVFQGELYFWILDDISIYDGYPYPETFPQYIGDSLQAFNKPYEIDCVGTPIVPNQLVVQFKPGTTDAEKQELRDDLGVDTYEGCMCDQLELWNLSPTVAPGSNSPSSVGPSIGINERKTLASAASRVDGVDFNKYNWNDLQKPITDTIPSGLMQLPGTLSQPGQVKLAIMDTGVDYEHPLLANAILQEGLEDAKNCLPQDTIGWNFVDANNNPWDNHRHGTHLTGIALNNLLDSTSCQSAGILPIKTHDAYGVSDLFDVSCGMYYALQQGAKVINCSWGWIGDSSVVLSNVIDTAGLYNAIIVAAAGNDSINLDEHQQYPVCSYQGNVIGVASANLSGEVSGFSNTSATYIDIAAYGDSILSTVPGGSLDRLSGTSMAAPAVAAAATALFCIRGEEAPYQEIIQCLLDSISQSILPENLVSGGRLLQFANSSCLTSVDIIELNQNDLNFTLFPNPSSVKTYLQAQSDYSALLHLQVYNGQGEHIYQAELNGVRKGQQIDLNLRNWPPGVYFVIIQTGKKTKTLRLVKHY